MTIFDLENSISLEFHAKDTIERKVLGLWAQPQFSEANLRCDLVGENVVFRVRGRVVGQMPFTMFDQYAVHEIAEIIVKATKKTFNK